MWPERENWTVISIAKKKSFHQKKRQKGASVCRRSKQHFFSSSCRHIREEAVYTVIANVESCCPTNFVLQELEDNKEKRVDESFGGLLETYTELLPPQ
jgi:hypothetical protein